MDFSEKIFNLSQKAIEVKDVLETEEATKTALVLPLINLLDYDIFNPKEIVPEFTADVGTRRGEKVDYAIMIEEKPSILIECKTIGTKLDRSKANQLYRYFTATCAKFGVLTDGIIYEFYSDLDEKNKMDKRPFFVFDLLNYSETDLNELKKFGKENYTEDKILFTATDLKYGRLIDAWLKEQFISPSEDFVKLVGSNIYDGRMTAQVTDWLNRLVKKSLDHTIKSKVRDNLQSALDQENNDPPMNPESTLEEINAKEDGIITTEEEIEGHKIIQAILSEIVEPDRIVMRDAKSYCAILLDDNNRKPICRLRLDGHQMRIGTFIEKTETLNDIEKLSDIFKLAALFKQTVQNYSA